MSSIPTAEDIFRLLGENKSEPMKQDDPYFRLKSVDNTGIAGFTSLIKKMLKKVMPEVKFASAWPGTDIKNTLPLITYEVIDRVPTKAIKPMLWYIIPDSEYEGQHVEIWGKEYDVEMQFDVWADTVAEVDGIGCTKDPSSCSLASSSGLCTPDFKPVLCPYCIDGILKRFEDFLLNYSGVFFEKAGVQHLVFRRQKPGKTVEKFNTPLICRSVVYSFRTQDIWVYKTADLTTVDLQLDVV